MILAAADGTTSTSKPNFRLIESSNTFLSSALGGMLKTTLPSFLAASCRRAHSACQLVWEKDEGVGQPNKKTTLSANARRIRVLHQSLVDFILPWSRPSFTESQTQD